MEDVLVSKDKPTLCYYSKSGYKSLSLTSCYNSIGLDSRNFGKENTELF